MKPKLIPILAWSVMLLISLLPDILFKEITGIIPAWLFWVKIGLLGGGLTASLLWKPLCSLQLYFVVLLLVHLLGWGADWLMLWLNSPAWFASLSSFARNLLAVQIPRAATGGLMVLIMLALTGNFSRFFFVVGKLDALAQPIPFILTRPPGIGSVQPLLPPCAWGCWFLSSCSDVPLLQEFYPLYCRSCPGSFSLQPVMLSARKCSTVPPG